MAMTGKTANERIASFSYLPTLDGWRALSVLAVIYFHCVQNGLRPGSIAEKLAARAHVGVDVFFAISGFLICGKLLTELKTSGTISLRKFYLRRCLRIFPAVWAYLAVLALLAYLGWITVSGWEFGSTLLFLRNYFPTYHDRVFGTYTAQFWSLAVEEHFYLLWPLTMLLLGPKLRRIGWTALGIALAVFVWRGIDLEHGWLMPMGTEVWVKTDTRIDALLWGCLMAIIFPWVWNTLRDTNLGRDLWIPVCIVAAAAILSKQPPGTTLLMAIVFPLMIVSTVLSPKSPLGRFLESAPLRWIGRLSYSIYIWQQLPEFRSSVTGSPILWAQQFPYNIAVIFVAAAASYYLVEMPMTRLGHRLTRKEEPRKPVAHEEVLVVSNIPLATVARGDSRPSRPIYTQ